MNVGDKVRKLKGYDFYSEVVSVFQNKNGDTRVVCESFLIPGLLHIFSPEQLATVHDTPEEFLAHLDRIQFDAQQATAEPVEVDVERTPRKIESDLRIERLARRAGKDKRE